MLGALFDPLYAIVGHLLAIFYALPPHSLGLSIIVLTIVVMLVQFPLIAKQTRSMIQMQRVQPEIKKIQQKYKDDRTKQNEELLKFYQENKINPLAGCLPLIIIFPIGIAVLDTFRRNFQDHIPEGSRLYADVCGRVNGTVRPPNAPHGVKPTVINSCGEYLSQLAKGGHAPGAMHFLGLKLNLSARDALGHGFVQAIPYILLIALVTFTSWYQVRQTQARQLQSGSAQPNAQMQAVTRIMPIFFGLISFEFNTATTLYFLVSNTWRIGQQQLVLGKMYEEDAAKHNKSAAKPDDDPPPSAKGPGAKAPPRGGGGGSGDGANGADNRPSPNAARRKKKRKR